MAATDPAAAAADVEMEDAGDDTQTVSFLEAALHANKFDYQSHIKLIEAYKLEGIHQKVRYAREDFSKYFPLSEALWEAWIDDEIAQKNKDKEYIVSLFRRSVKDYISTKLWLKFAEFAVTMEEDDEDDDDDEDEDEGEKERPKWQPTPREVFSDAVGNVGLHVTEGGKLWKKWRSHELEQLDELIAQLAVKKDDGMASMVSEQRKFITNLFERELRIPLAKLETTWEEYKEFRAKHFDDKEIPSHVEASYTSTLQILNETYLPLEEKLKDATANMRVVYKEYLIVEKSLKQPIRVLLCFERAIKDQPLDPEIWVDYTTYMDTNLPGSPEILPAHVRATRNTPWVPIVWQNYMRACERMQDFNKVEEVFAQGVKAGMSATGDYLLLYQSYCEFKCRQIKSAEDAEGIEEWRRLTKESQALLANMEGADPNMQLTFYIARVEAKKFSNMENARAELDQAVLTKTGCGKYAQAWLSYVQLEQAYGTMENCRKLYSRAITCVADYPESITQSWLQFERDFGTLSDWDTAKMKTDKRMAIVNEQRAQAAQKEAERKAAFKAARAEKKRKDRDESGQSGDGRKRHRTQAPGEDGEPQRREFDEEASKRTVFVSNLSYTVNEEMLNGLFTNFGEVKEVRLVKKPDGTSKGFAYVEFASESSLTEALKTDRADLEGRPMFVSTCVDKSKNPTKFKFSTEMDHKTLFVRNLHFAATKEMIEEAFKQFGELKEIRMVTKRSGAPKGIAYVEFVEEAAAKKALMQANGRPLNGRSMEIAYSNPPKKRGPREEGDERERPQRSTIASKPTLGRAGFTPRAMHRGPKQRASFAMNKSQAKTNTTFVRAGEANKKTETDTKPKSNADFRSMLLGSK